MVVLNGGPSSLGVTQQTAFSWNRTLFSSPLQAFNQTIIANHLAYHLFSYISFYSLLFIIITSRRISSTWRMKPTSLLLATPTMSVLV